MALHAQAGHHHRAPAPRDRHRFARGADRAAHRAHQPPDRAPKVHTKDHHSRRGLLMLVGRRRRMLDYLRSHRRRALPRASSPSSACAADAFALTRALAVAPSQLGRHAVRIAPIGGVHRSCHRPSGRSCRLSVAHSVAAPPSGRVQQSAGSPTGNRPAAPNSDGETCAVRKEPFVADPIRVSRSHLRYRQDAFLRDRQARAAGQGAVVATHRRHDRARPPPTPPSDVRPGIDFFPLTVDVEERMYAAGKIPGSFFRREGRPGEARDPHLPAHRPPAAPVVPDGFRNEVQVIATILGADLENPHDVAVDQRRVGGADDLGHPVRRPDRRGAPRVHARRRVDRRTRRTRRATSRRSSSSSPVVELDDGDVAIMMVEAGGTEKSLGALRRGRPEGRPRRSSPSGLEASKVWIKASIDLQRQLVAERRSRPTARSTPIEYTPNVDYTARRVRGRRAARRRRRSPRR